VCVCVSACAGVCACVCTCVYVCVSVFSCACLITQRGLFLKEFLGAQEEAALVGAGPAAEAADDGQGVAQDAVGNAGETLSLVTWPGYVFFWRLARMVSRGSVWPGWCPVVLYVNACGFV
jgi:hypothetical protein